MFSPALVFLALLATAIAQQCPDGRPPFGPCTPSCPPGFECDPVLQQCCPAANSTGSSTFSPIVFPTIRPNPQPLATASPATSCKDKLNPKTGTSDCPLRSGLCDVPIYSSVMTEQCPKTCKRCPGTITTLLPPGTPCVDLVNPVSNASDCPLRTSLCSDPIYRDVMVKQCPRTCGFCNPNSNAGTARPMMRSPTAETKRVIKNPSSLHKNVKMSQDEFNSPYFVETTHQDYVGNGMR